MRFVPRALPACLLALALALPLTGPARAQQQERPPTPVTVVTVHQEDVTITSTVPGRVVASGVAEVRPQVNGIIVEQLFKEGSSVKAGDVLFRIDSGTYEADVAAAEASVAQAEVALASAGREVKRVQALRTRNVMSEQALDEATTARDTANANLKAANARLLASRIDLERTTIRAQLTGAIGRTLVTQGALVTAGQSEPLAVIRKLDPIYVDLAQSAADLVRWKRSGPAGITPSTHTKVTLTLADRKPYDYQGELTAAEPHVDERTGVVTMRMEFPNPRGMLLPGMYVQAEVPQGVVRGAVLVPQEGVSRDRRGNPVALVVNGENVLEERQLTIVGDRGADWIASEGLKDGDRVMVAGFQKTGVGAKVAPQEREAVAAQN